ncbi:MAG: hypothetical protein ACJ73E_08105 [Mycobacteriales bacterium]
MLDLLGIEDGPVYAELPPVAEAAELVARTINPALAAERGPQDLSAAFELHPVLATEVAAASGPGRPYRVLRWGVFVPDPDYADGPYGELVAYGAVRRRRDGQLRYDPRGLHEPLTAEQLGVLLAEAGDPRDAAALLGGAAPDRTLR